ncbi:ATP-binding protein [Bacillus alkalicellulosilyticus]|uniref:ATP-binding protein n=1 Tax=Alkalihalobacterium alkalicellulosilyticum TaxID=1912214 RepID=UPI000995F7FA|nr:ATP-binding protein [Bacillus alkalicellulosilyticus]
MENYLEALLLNMLFLVVFLLFIPHLIETNFNNLSTSQKKGIKFISVLIAVISCMLFPFTIRDEILMDLRTVAIVFGGLYLGKMASVLLVSIFIFLRFYLSSGLGSGFYASVIAILGILFLLLLISNSFEKASKEKRIVIACSISLCISTSVLLIRGLLFNHLIITDDFKLVLTFYSIHFISTFFIFYFYEMIRETAYVNNRIINAEKLEIVSHLASSISHEVRNPLTVVKGFLQMINQNGLKEDKTRFYIDLSLQEIDRANDIIENYLTFAKPAHQEHQNINIKEVVEHSLNVITPLANMNCVNLQSKVDLCYIKGDLLLLQQCLLNITKNCIEAMPNGGELDIRVGKINGDTVIEIADNGKGMTDEQLQRIGEPFYTTKGREGTGLGMMAVIKIIDIMNGKLKVTSKIDEGTKFEIKFPSVR